MNNEETKDKTMIWETEILDGVLTIKDKDDNLIFANRFTMPADDAVGPEAKKNILHAAVGRRLEFRCVKHSITWLVSTRPEPYEHFIFRRTDIPDVDYHITLSNDHSLSRIGFCPSGGSTEHTKEFPDFLKQMAEKQYDDLTLSFCTPTKLLPEINRVAQLRYLTLMECSFDNSEEVFKEIGRMGQLRGLCLHGMWCGLLNAAAVGELCKLKIFETLCVRTGFPISVDAVRELGKLKNLRALHLELWGNCRIEHERRTALVSALSALRSLEKLEFLTLSVSPRLSPGELTLPPSLKYLEINNIVCRLPVRPAKSKPAPEKTKPDDGGPSLF